MNYKPFITEPKLFQALCFTKITDPKITAPILCQAIVINKQAGAENFKQRI